MMPALLPYPALCACYDSLLASALIFRAVAMAPGATLCWMAWTAVRAEKDAPYVRSTCRTCACRLAATAARTTAVTRAAPPMAARDLVQALLQITPAVTGRRHGPHRLPHPFHRRRPLHCRYTPRRKCHRRRLHLLCLCDSWKLRPGHFNHLFYVRRHRYRFGRSPLRRPRQVAVSSSPCLSSPRGTQRRHRSRQRLSPARGPWHRRLRPTTTGHLPLPAPQVL